MSKQQPGRSRYAHLEALAEEIASSLKQRRERMARGHDPAQPFQIEIDNEEISLSLSFTANKLLPLLKSVAACDDLRQQLRRKNSDQTLHLEQSGLIVDLDHNLQRYYNEYVISLHSGVSPHETFPITEWPLLVQRLGLRHTKSEAELDRMARRAEKFIRTHATQKLMRVLEQMLFEAVQAATRQPVSDTRRRELEGLGSLVDECWELRPADKYSPATRRRWDKSEVEEMLRWAIDAIGPWKTVTYEAAAARLQKELAFTPMLTGETLRKVVAHHQISWKEIEETEKVGKISGNGATILVQDKTLAATFPPTPKDISRIFIKTTQYAENTDRTSRPPSNPSLKGRLGLLPL